jgi:hypothetical protein
LIQYTGRLVFIARTSLPALAETGHVVECLYTMQSAGRDFSLMLMIVLMFVPQAAP